VQFISSDVRLINTPQPTGTLTIPASQTSGSYTTTTGNPEQVANVTVNAVTPMTSVVRLVQKTVQILPNR